MPTEIPGQPIRPPDKLPGRRKEEDRNKSDDSILSGDLGSMNIVGKGGVSPTKNDVPDKDTDRVNHSPVEETDKNSQLRENDTDEAGDDAPISGDVGPFKKVEKRTDNDSRLKYSFSQSMIDVLLIAEGIRMQVEKDAKEAGSREQIELLSEILLLGLYAKEEGPARILFESFGLAPRHLMAWVRNQYGYLPKDIDINPGFAENVPKDRVYQSDIYSENTLAIFSQAEKIQQRKNAQEIRTRHVLHAIFELGNERIESSPASRPNLPVVFEWFMVMGVNTKDVEEIFDSLNESNPVTHQLFGYSPGSAFADMAAEEDTLGFNRYAKSLAEIIMHDATMPPIVIGIYGAWGTGKSTFMRLVKKYLVLWDKREKEKVWERIIGVFTRNGEFITRAKQKKTRILCVEYNAWAHMDAEKVWASLLNAVSNRLDDDLGWHERIRFWITRRNWRKFLAAFLTLIPVLFSLAWFFTNFLSSLPDEYVALLGSTAIAPFVSMLIFLATKTKPLTDTILQAAKDVDFSEFDGVMSDVQKELHNVIEEKYIQTTKDENNPKKLIKKSKLKVVVFIDELDRCPLEQVVNILEAIKLFLAENIFIVLLAVDTRVVAEAITLHYKDVDNPDLSREYMEKIIQVPIQVPHPSKPQVEEFLENLMPVESREGDEETTDAEEQTSVAGASISTSPRVSQNRNPTFFTEERYEKLQLEDTVTEQKAIANAAYKLLKSNPRQIKRLLNTYRYVKVLGFRTGKQIGKKEWQVSTVNWLALTMCWPIFMELLAKKDEVNFSASKPVLSPDTYKLVVQETIKVDRNEKVPPLDVLEKFLPTNDWLEEYLELANNFIIEKPPRKQSDKSR